MNLHSILEQAQIFKKSLVLQRMEFLKSVDTVDTSIYFIKSGSVKLSLYQQGEEQIIRFGYRNNLVVALDSFMTEASSPYAIQALKKTEILVASKADFEAIMKRDETHLRYYVEFLQQLVIEQLEREKDLLISSPKERYEQVLQRSPQLFQEIPQRYIANYLRMTPETLSRLQKS